MNWIPKNEHIQHVRTTQRAPLSKQIAELCNVSSEQAAFLIHFGAVWVEKKRQAEDIEIQSGTYLRVHLFPRRYPSKAVDWEKRIVKDSKEWILINKPPRIPVPTTVDNLHENVVAAMQEVTHRPLYVTHRLDHPTRGLVLLAKTKEYLTKFNRMLADRKIEKKYRALTSNEVPIGLLIHYMEESKSSPKKLFTENSPKLLECQTRVDDSSRCSPFWESEITLMTGRTHQIRAQLAFIGAPIIGDSRYGGTPENSFDAECIALQAYRLEFDGLAFEIDREW